MCIFSGTGLHHFEKKFGLDRMFDVGICEQHAVTMAAGMAAEGLVPYAAIYSSFMQVVKGGGNMLGLLC